jgi:hypothetical protein
VPDYLGNIRVPEVIPSGVFPLVPDYPHGRAHRPEVIVHQFGSANAKIEQRFLLGTGAKRFNVRKAYLRESDRIALRDFWQSKAGPTVRSPTTYRTMMAMGLRPISAGLSMTGSPGRRFRTPCARSVSR